MSKILIVGDPHLKASNIELVKRFLKWILDTCSIEKPDMVVFLGDVFHTHAVLRSEIMALVADHIKALTKIVAPVITLIGNHDQAHAKTPEIHAWLPFMGYKDFYVIDKPVLSQHGFYFIPYIDNPDTFQSVLEKAMSSSNLIFCHQTFRGADFGFITTKEGAIVPKDYKGLIVAGHIHKPQRLGPVWYPGTPFAQESADHNQQKGIYLLDTVTMETTFLRSPLPQWITVTASLSDYETVIGKMNKENRNHLVLTGSNQELRALVDTKTFKTLKKEYGFSVKRQPNIENDTRQSQRRILTLEEAVISYIDGIYQGDVDKDTLKTYCLDALK